MMPFSFSTTKTVIFRRGAAKEIDSVAGALLGPRILVVTDPGLSRLGLYNPALEALRLQGKTVVLFDAVEADPSVGTLQAACALGANSNVTGVLGFGGGSSLDVAKVASLLLGSKQPLDEAWGVNNAKGSRLPLVLVPTTSGTGSEVTPVAILTFGGEEKRGISSPILLPDIALLDAELTLGLPPQITAATGIDAMVHAIEAYTSTNANNNPLSRILAREALRLLGSHIERAVSDGQDIAAREAMLLGSMLAGQAFANSPVAAVHALAYPIGGIFHVPHGLSNALVLTSVMRFNLPAAGVAYTEIAADVFPGLADVAAADRASAFVRSLGELILRLQMPSRLRELGIPEDALPRMASEAMKQQRLLVNNPRAVSEADAFAIYSEAW
ncbi:iron-containing alcohol dehydrogenase [Sinorhizobium sp. GL28]|uniref:iron-containing alcohol dehydrogenase n=1 Tax=Sinorhizobium sp. GL28 TaxID=1358418 RepID=UPI00071C74DF|nr:iron-containing alcohol dehydrogenase [Sinorhizobium sp. GL28]KSV84158.1 alcohol dehydrogenase [Sinorhizobium sp. GL28]